MNSPENARVETTFVFLWARVSSAPQSNVKVNQNSEQINDYLINFVTYFKTTWQCLCCLGVLKIIYIIQMQTFITTVATGSTIPLYL